MKKILLLFLSTVSALADVPVPPAATQAQANQGTATFPYISPATLSGYAGSLAGPTNGVTATGVTNIALIVAQGVTATNVSGVTITNATIGDAVTLTSSNTLGTGQIPLSQLPAGVVTNNGYASTLQITNVLVGNILGIPDINGNQIVQSGTIMFNSELAPDQFSIGAELLWTNQADGFVGCILQPDFHATPQHIMYIGTGIAGQGTFDAIGFGVNATNASGIPTEQGRFVFGATSQKGGVGIIPYYNIFTNGGFQISPFANGCSLYWLTWHKYATNWDYTSTNTSTPFMGSDGIWSSWFGAIGLTNSFGYNTLHTFYSGDAINLTNIQMTALPLPGLANGVVTNGATENPVFGRVSLSSGITIQGGITNSSPGGSLWTLDNQGNFNNVVSLQNFGANSDFIDINGNMSWGGGAFVETNGYIWATTFQGGHNAANGATGGTSKVGIQTNSSGPHGIYLCFTNGLFINQLQY